MNKILISLFLGVSILASADAAVVQSKGDFVDKFRQLEEVLPTPNDYRNAAGEPGKEYWQQQVDYKIDVNLDEDRRRISASQTVTYTNNSPYRLKYLWVQLEQNRFSQTGLALTLSQSALHLLETLLGVVLRLSFLSIRNLPRSAWLNCVVINFKMMLSSVIF